MSVIRTPRDQGAFATLKLTCSTHVNALKVTIPYEQRQLERHVVALLVDLIDFYDFFGHGRSVCISLPLGYPLVLSLPAGMR